LRTSQALWNNTAQMLISSQIVGDGLEVTAKYTSRPHPEVAPAETCRCGFYNFNDLRSAGKVLGDTIDGGVLILTESCGKIVMHTNVFRSEWTRPMGVVYPFTYKMEKKALGVDSFWFAEWLRVGPTMQFKRPEWVSDVLVQSLYGHIASHEAIMVAQKLHLPVFAPSEATQMIRANWSENNL
jgi:hypothetical protein